MADVAVVVLNYNGCHYLDACLASLRRLPTSIEIVVADNGSTDDSLAHLHAHHPDVRVLALQHNWGFAEGYNRALALVNTPWVVLLNNDAMLEPNWLNYLLATAVEHPRAFALGGKLLFSGVRGRVIQSVGSRFTSAGTAFELGWGQPDVGQYDVPVPTASIPAAAMLVRRDIFFELGGFDSTYFAYLEDVDVCWRAWLSGYEVWYDPRAVAFHRFGGSWGGRASPTRIYYMQRNRLANIVKLLEPMSLPAALALSIAYDSYRLLEYSARRDWPALRALVTGAFAFGRALPQLLRERERIQSARQLRDSDLRAKGLLVSALEGFREYRRLGKLAPLFEAGGAAS
jgi:GT2 family glycosyltransferase